MDNNEPHVAGSTAAQLDGATVATVALPVAETIVVTPKAPTGTAALEAVDAAPVAPSNPPVAVTPQPRDEAAEPRPVPDMPEPTCPTDCRHDVRAAVLVTLPLVPLLATVLTVLFYLAPTSSLVAQMAPTWILTNALLSGAASATVVGILIAVGYYAFRGTAADHANARAYSELCQRVRGLDVRRRVACAGSDGSLTQQSACNETRAYLGVLVQELSKPGMRWVLATGYINMWSLVHRAEEALIQIEPWENVLRGSQNDLRRIQGSTIAGSGQADVVAQLKQAMEALGGAHAADARSTGDAVARATLRQVRQLINEFRDNLWDALVRSRNHLLAALTLTGIVTYLLLALAVYGLAGTLPRTPPVLLNDPIAAASAFYLVGAAVGLFNRLNDEATSASDVEDYGLTMARLILTPVLSGLAAVGGALLIAMIPATINGDVLSPQAPAAVTATVPAPDATSTVAAPAPAPPTAPQASAGMSRPSLSTIFHLGQNPFGLVFAAIFGLTPSLLISSIRKAADGYKLQIRNSGASQQAGPP